MNQRMRWIAGTGLLGMAGVTIACAHATQKLSEFHATAMRDSVQQTLDRFRHYSANRQWDSLMTLYVDDARFKWLENGALRYRSPTAIKTALSGLSANARIETTYRETEIIPLAPGAAWVATLYQTRFVQGDAPAFEFGGAITMTLIHEAGGWRILNGHTSSPIPRQR